MRVFFLTNQDDVAELSLMESQEFCGNMVILKSIPFISYCEHHMLPMFGNVSIGYVPDTEIVGIGSITRIVKMATRKLQLQERISIEITDALNSALSPKGVIVCLETTQLCLMFDSGIENMNTRMQTMHSTGIFKCDTNLRSEFFNLIK